MNDPRQFRPLFYFLLVLGVSSYCWAAEEATMWAIVVAAMLVNAGLVMSGRFRPMPRFISALVTVGAFIVSIILLWNTQGGIIAIVADFLMFLHLIKLYEQRGDRDVAQTLVLNLLLVVAGAITTASLWFALTMAIYLMLALFVSLALYQQTELEATAAAMGPAAPPDVGDSGRIAPGASHKTADARSFRQSMVRVMFFMTTMSTAVGVAVFVFFPRGLAADLLGALPVLQVADPVTGLDDQTQVEQMVKVSQDTEVVARVKELLDGKPVNGTQPLWLRGKTVDVYSGNGVDPTTGRITSRPWTWDGGGPYSASGRYATHQDTFGSDQINAWNPLDAGDAETNTLNVCSVQLEPTGTTILVTPGRTLSFKVKGTQSPKTAVHFFSVDWTVRSGEPINWPMTYEVTFDPRVTPPRSSDSEIPPAPLLPPSRNINPAIVALAEDPAVCGVDANGVSLVKLFKSGRTDLAAAIAQNFQDYLHDKGRFKYTLDMSDQDKMLNGQDPIVVFLTQTRRGYCEFFASAMTLMCQSVNLRARMVFGYRCDDYSEVGGYYEVRQSDAHAWTEVLIDNSDGSVWERFDPTTGDYITRPDTSLSGKLMQFLDYLNYKWATGVVTYDQPARQAMVHGITIRLHEVFGGIGSVLHLMTYLKDAQSWFISPTLPAAVIAMMSLLIVAAIIWYVVESTRLRRRARRVGIDGLDRSDQHRLVRQLAFYDQMIVLLERHDILRSPHMTPLEFSQSLWFLPPVVYQDIHRLTRIFYRIRYGQAALDEPRRKRLSVSIDHIESILAGERVDRPGGIGRFFRRKTI